MTQRAGGPRLPGGSRPNRLARGPAPGFTCTSIARGRPGEPPPCHNASSQPLSPSRIIDFKPNSWLPPRSICPEPPITPDSFIYLFIFSRVTCAAHLPRARRSWGGRGSAGAAGHGKRKRARLQDRWKGMCVAVLANHACPPGTRGESRIPNPGCPGLGEPGERTGHGFARVDDDVPLSSCFSPKILHATLALMNYSLTSFQIMPTLFMCP